MSTRITYWFDQTSAADDPRWIVSLEDGDSSRTVRVLPAGATEAWAHKVAATQAARRQLPLLRHPEEALAAPAPVPVKNPAAVALGRRGGQATSAKKTAAARANAMRPRAGRVAVVLSVRDVGVHFGCEGIVRRARDRRVIWRSDTPRPYGFRRAAMDDAKEWAINHGYIHIEEDRLTD